MFGCGKFNSISTIYTLDIFKKYLKKEATENTMVKMGRWAVVISLIIAILINWQDSLGIGTKGGFEFIQKYTGYISPAIFPVFLLGFFWKKTTSKAAISGIIGGVLLAILFDKYLPGIAGHDTFLYTAFLNADGYYEIPFLVQMGWVFFFTMFIIIGVSWLDVPGRSKANAMEVDASMFKISLQHWALIITILLLVTMLYIRFW